MVHSACAVYIPLPSTVRHDARMSERHERTGTASAYVRLAKITVDAFIEAARESLESAGTILIGTPS
jgi:hypothetical protein